MSLLKDAKDASASLVSISRAWDFVNAFIFSSIIHRNLRAKPTLSQVVVFLNHLSTILEFTTALSSHNFAFCAKSESFELRVHHVRIVDWRIRELISFLSARRLDIHLVWVSKGHMAGRNRRIDIDIANALVGFLDVRLIVILEGLAVLSDDFRLIHCLRLVHLSCKSLLTHQGRHSRLLAHVLLIRKLTLLCLLHLAIVREQIKGFLKLIVHSLVNEF